MDATWVPVISGAVGAGGAVVAQAVAAWFTGRREGKKHAWEKSQVYAQTKREVYARFLAQMERRTQVLGDAHDDPHGSEWFDHEESTAWQHEAAAVLAEISLFDYEIARRGRRLVRAARLWEHSLLHETSDDTPSVRAREYYRARAHLVEVMQLDLDIRETETSKELEA
jgi:hypothetical protein